MTIFFSPDHCEVEMGWHWYLEFEIKRSIAASVELPSVLDPMSCFASLMLQFDVSRAEMHKVSPVSFALSYQTLLPTQTGKQFSPTLLNGLCPRRQT